MSINQKKDYQEWFKKADEDELSVKAILKESGAPSTACFFISTDSRKIFKRFSYFL